MDIKNMGILMGYLGILMELLWFTMVYGLILYGFIGMICWDNDRIILGY